MSKDKQPDFKYLPAEYNICKFDVVVGHHHWVRLCKVAHDLNTSVDVILALTLEHFLAKMGYLDEEGDPTDTVKVSVTLRDVIKNPQSLVDQILSEEENNVENFLDDNF